MPNWKLQWRNIRIYAGFSWSVKAMGVNSLLESGEHFLMWDFDSATLDDVKRSLETVVHRFNLSVVTICQSHAGGGYHAYCYTVVPWPEAIYIAMTTEHVDPKWVKVAMLREYFTLRFEGKYLVAPQPVAVIPGKSVPDIHPGEITNITTYWTKKGKSNATL